ncbi:UNVERIFIED_CONTAM: 3'5'-cyclic nucleotide phosphodiesterase domain-containing protein [Hammondia hammondi]|eukprot:XP_008882798.1 3'5'-cyclic nucleotide phosphodiesterase domain-containing protein [Hammondia hammondi]
MLCTAKLLQTMGGTMQILSSPSRGMFVSFQIRTRARFRLLDFQKGFHASFCQQRQQRIVSLGLAPETSRALQFLCKDVGIQFTACYCLRHLRESLATETRTFSLAFVLGDFVTISANAADPASRPLTPAELFREAQEAAALRPPPGCGLPLVKVFVSSRGDHNSQDGKGKVESHQHPLPDDVTKLSVPVRTDALIQILARALDTVEGSRSADESIQGESEMEPAVPVMPGELVSPSPRSEGGKSAAGLGRKSLLLSCDRPEANEASGKRADSSPQKKKRSAFRISVARRRTLRASTSPHSQRESSVTSEAARRRHLLYSVFRGKDSPPRRSSRDTNDKASLSDDSKDRDESDDEPVELFPLHNETLQPLFPGGDQIPEPLLFDVNSVVQAVNQVGLSRPAEQLAAAIAETPFQKDLDASAKFIDALDSSLALLRYYQALPGHDGTLQKRKGRSGRLTDLDPQGIDRTWRPESKRKNPLAMMQSLSALQVKVPDEPEVQAFFNFASSALSVEDPISIHQVLNWDFHILNLTPSTATRVARDLLHHFAATAQVEIPGEILMGFAVALYKNYEQNPYHNFFHALNVAQVCCLLMALPDVAARFQPLDYFVLSVAALGHDLGHPGANNLFVSRNDGVPSRLYQNRSVLENYHAALLFQILRHPRFNVFCSIPPQAFSACRQRIIGAILWTDMAKHFDMVAQLKEKIEGEMVLTEGIIVTLQKPYLEGLLLHASDISNPMLRFELSYDWAVRACDEFFQQNRLEEKLGQPLHMPAFAEFDLYNVAKCQVNFIDFICRPLFGSLAQMFPAQLGDRAAELRKNRNKWKSIIDRHERR